MNVPVMLGEKAVATIVLGCMTTDHALALQRFGCLLLSLWVSCGILRVSIDGIRLRAVHVKGALKAALSAHQLQPVLAQRSPKAAALHHDVGGEPLGIYEDWKF